MDRSDFNWKKSRAQQRRREKRKKDFSHINRNSQQDTAYTDKAEESSDVTPSETDVLKEKHDTKSNFNDNSDEKPVIDFSNLKRETEEIEKLTKKNQYEISSSWDPYVGSENIDNLVHESEEPADVLKLLQSPSSYGGHFLLKEEQDWAVTSKMLLNGCFALDLKLLAQGLSCIPFYVRHGLPENVFSVEELEQMTHGLTKTCEVYFRSVKEEIVTDKNRNARVNTCNEQNLQILKQDSVKTDFKCAETSYLDHSIINSNRHGDASTTESHYDSGNIMEKHNIFALEKCIESVAMCKTHKFPLEEDFRCKDESKSEHTINATQNGKIYNETELKNVKNPLPVSVIISETFDKHSSTIKESRTPEKIIGLLCETVVSTSSCVTERKDTTSSPMSAFSKSHKSNKRENTTSVPNNRQFVKECEDKSKLSELDSISNISENAKEDNTLQKTHKCSNSAPDELDFLLSLQDSVKKQSSDSIHQKSPGTSYLPAPKITSAPNVTEKDESLEDWLDSVLSG